MEQLIGSGILVAVGAGLTWAVMAHRHRVMKLALDMMAKKCVGIAVELVEAEREVEAQRAIARLNGEAVQHWHAVVGNALEYCKQFRVRGAVVAGILSGEQDQ